MDYAYVYVMYLCEYDRLMARVMGYVCTYISVRVSVLDGGEREREVRRR